MSTASQPTTPSKAYGVPRRFDMATLFVCVAGYMFLFAGLRLLSTQPGMLGWIRPTTYFKIAGLITAVGLGQAVLFGGRKPREASLAIGIVYTVLLTLTHVLAHELRSIRLSVHSSEILFVAVLLGCLGGYLSGAMVAGVFLVADRLRRRLGWTSLEASEPQAVEDRESKISIEAANSIDEAPSTDGDRLHPLDRE